MRLAASNIAWPAADRDAAYALLARHGFTGLEIAPGLFFRDAADPFVPTPDEAAAAIGPMRRAGLELVSMQSLLFGVTDASLFDGAAARGRLVAAVRRAVALAARFAIPNLVFGSPLQRIIPAGMTRSDAEAVALATFRTLGDEAARAGCTIAIEPNPAAYGTNFLTDLDETLDFVAAADHPAIGLNFDIGALHMNGQFDRIEEIAARAARRIVHVHVSESHLAPAPANAHEAARALRALAAADYAGWFSIEMRAPESDAIAVFARCVERLAVAAESEVAA